MDRTKADIIQELLSGPHAELISSTVSCTRTFQKLGQATHCGECIQCIDRLFASHATEAEKWDHRGIYSHFPITDTIESREAKTTAIDYLRQAVDLSNLSCDEFYDVFLEDLADVVDWLPFGDSEFERIEKLWQLFRRHGDSVLAGVRRMQELHDDPRRALATDSLLALVADREYLRPKVRRLSESIAKIVCVAIPQMFRTNKPKDEPDLNEKLAGLIATHYSELHSEHPTVSFACARVIPDHELRSHDLLIESKYAKKGRVAKVTDGIASDLTKYPPSAHILFVVFDPDHAIPRDDQFVQEIEEKGRCSVLVLR